MGNFTKGEWHIPHLARADIKCDCGYLFAGEGGSLIATIHQQNNEEYNENNYPGQEEAKANAKLICASKDLYFALKELIQVKEWKDKNGKDEHYLKAQPIAWDNARKALEKAI